MNWFDSEENDQKERATLLKYYFSECTIHGSYILTVAIGFFAFIQIIEFIQENVIFPEMFVILAFSLFITISIYLLARTFFWGILASLALHIREVSVEEAKKGMDLKLQKISLMFRIHQGCTDFFKKSHQLPNFFVGVGRKRSYSLVLYLVIFLMIALILNNLVPILIL